MKYLVMPSVAAAEERSRTAWRQVIGSEPTGGTNSLWSICEHPSDERAALMIGDAPEEAGIGLSQDAYDALLTLDEHAALAGSMSSDWTRQED
jgi:hypothetical protein